MIYVGSLKYSPVYKSHCCAFGEACEDEGYIVKYLFSHEYKWMLPNEIKTKTIFVGNSKDIPALLIDTLNINNLKILKKNISRDKPTHIYMHNYHLLNHYISKLGKKQGYTFIYHMHEPYVKNKSDYGGFARYWLYLNEVMVEKLLLDTDVAIVSSKEASKLFDLRYPWFQGKKKEIPLIYEDLGKEIAPKEQRKYITFVGPTMPSKGADIFLKIIDYSAKHDLGYDFLLLSRTKVNNSSFHNKANLTVFCRNRISDEDYGEIIRKSLIVLVPYKRITQSSVLLVSYMYGTPVVSSNVGGLPEFVKHEETGFLVDKDAPVEKWIEGINYTSANFARMSVNCRNYFVEAFSGKNWKKYLNVLGL